MGERQELEAAENEANGSSAAKKKAPATKMTQAQIAQRQALLAAAKAKPAAKKSIDQPKLEKNTNKEDDLVEATGIDAALSALGGDEKKASKMSYKEFEDIQLPGVKEENPGLKNSQAKDKVWKMWERAAENPKNQEK